MYLLSLLSVMLFTANNINFVTSVIPVTTVTTVNTFNTVNTAYTVNTVTAVVTIVTTATTIGFYCLYGFCTSIHLYFLIAGLCRHICLIWPNLIGIKKVANTLQFSTEQPEMLFLLLLFLGEGHVVKLSGLFSVLFYN